MMLKLLLELFFMKQAHSVLYFKFIHIFLEFLEFLQCFDKLENVVVYYPV